MGFQFIDNAAAQRTLQKCATEVELSLTTAYEVASVILDAQTGARFPKPARPPVVEKIEPTVKRKLCLEHREKIFTFSSGATWVACTATDCYFGKPHPMTGTIQRKHSDGTPGGVVYASGVELEPRVEQEPEALLDDEQELLPPTTPMVAGRDEPKPAIDDEAVNVLSQSDDPDNDIEDGDDNYEE